MKALKIVAFVVGGIVVLLAVLLALAFTSSVQTWAVRKYAQQPGMTVEVGRVAAGLSAADISDLRVVKDGMVITAKAVSARYSAWDYISKKRINADRVEVLDAVVDLRGSSAGVPPAPTPKAGETPAPGKASTPRATATAQKQTPFAGVLGQAKLPFDVRVASLAAKGRALLPEDQTVVFDVKGTNIETGQRGTLEWAVDFADAKKAAALRALRSTGSAALHIAPDRRIDLVEIDVTTAAVGPQLPPDRVKLVAKAEQPTAGGNEGYTATVGLIRGGNNVETIAKTNAQFLVASREITGAWEINVRSEQLAALLGGLGLPQVAANGAGKFNLKPDTTAASASGDLQGDVSQLAKLSPALDAIGSVHFKTTFDGAFADNIANLAKLDLEVTARDGRKFAQITSLQKVAYNLGDKRVTLADPKAELARISLQALPLAWAQSFAKPMQIESGDLSMVLAVEAEPDGSRVRARAVEPLALRNVTVRDANKKALVEKLTLTTRPTVDYSAAKIMAQLAELNMSLPTGDALTGNINAEVTDVAKTPSIAFATQLQAKVVGAIKPYLPANFDPGPLAIETSVQGRMQGDVLNVTKSTTTVNRAGGGLLVAVELQQPVTANLKASTFSFANPTATAARVRVGEIPLAWAEAFVAKSKFAGVFAGTTLDISARSVDDLTVNMTQPVVLRGVGATMDGKPMAQGIDLTTDLTATKRGNAITYEVRKLDVKQGETSLVSVVVAGQANLGAKFTGAAKGKLDADLAAIMKQPVLAQNATLASGKLTSEFDAQLGDTIQAKATIAGRNLIAKQDNRVLGDLDVNLNANVKPDGSGTITAPITLANPQRKSDIAINGAFGKTQKGDKFLFTGKIASNQIFVDDFQPLAALAPSSPSTPANQPQVSRPGQPIVIHAPTTPGPGTTSGGRDTVPFWNAVNGKVEVDLKRIVYGKDYTITGVHGTAVITDTKLSLDGLEGRFKENPFKLAGGVTFAANQPKPYALVASADVNNFDVGAFLRAANPNEKPALETKATVSAKVNGNGGTVGDLAKNAFGKFELTGSKGTMYLLERKGTAGTLVNAASLGLAILGAARGSEGASALSEIARLLNSVPFDSVKMQVERGADLNFKLTSLEVLSPILRTTGSGTVASKSTDDLANAPMNIVLQLGAKGELGYLLQRVGMLGANKDEKGYQLMSRTFTIGGTTGKPDNSALWKLLGEAALGALAR